MFIARSVASGQLLDYKFSDSYKHMPTLSGRAKVLHEKAYTEETYQKYCDTSDTFHGCDEREPFVLAPAFCHRPDHDVESIYWVLFYTLIRALPRVPSSSTKVDLKPYWKANEIFRNLVIDDSDQDTRDLLFNRNFRGIAKILDPKLAPLSQMLVDMGDQIQPSMVTFPRFRSKTTFTRQCGGRYSSKLSK